MTARAMSSAVRTSPVRSRIVSIAWVTVGSVLWPCSSVSTKPGSTQLTRIPLCSASWRSASEKAVTPNLVRL